MNVSYRDGAGIVHVYHEPKVERILYYSESGHSQINDTVDGKKRLKRPMEMSPKIDLIPFDDDSKNYRSIVEGNAKCIEDSELEEIELLPHGTEYE